MPDLRRASCDSMSIDELKAHHAVSASRPYSDAARRRDPARGDDPACWVRSGSIVSAFGLREGLLYRDLDAADAGRGPAACSGAGGRRAAWPLRRPWRGARPVDGPAVPGRQRRTCSGCGWRPACWAISPGTPIPIFAPSAPSTWRIHGNWVGIDAHGRAVLGRALCSAFGGDGGFSPRAGGAAEAGRKRAGQRLGTCIAPCPAPERRHRGAAAQDQHRPEAGQADPVDSRQISGALFARRSSGACSSLARRWSAGREVRFT